MTNLTGTMRGQSDIITLTDDRENGLLHASTGTVDFALGDAELISGRARGGNDIMTGGADTTPPAAGGDWCVNMLLGDSYTMNGSGRGGDDRMTGGVNARNLIYGDAYDMEGAARGGNDLLLGPAQSVALDYSSRYMGDANHMSGDSRGGNDTILLNGEVYVSAFGDAFTMLDRSVGGNDLLASTAAPGADVYLYGDASGKSGTAKSGNDTLNGADGARVNFLYGDVVNSFGGAFGNDLLVAGDGAEVVNWMYGDAERVSGGTTRGGNDIFVGGTGIDYMIGDFKDTFTHAPGGRDIFRFAASTGTGDAILGFEQGVDRIAIDRSTGIRDFAGLEFEEEDGRGLIVHLDGNNKILVLNLYALEPGDFLFR